MRHKVFAVSLSQTRPKRNGARRVTHLHPLDSPSYRVLASRIPASSPIAFQHMTDRSNRQLPPIVFPDVCVTQRDVFLGGTRAMKLKVLTIAIAVSLFLAAR